MTTIREELNKILWGHRDQLDEFYIAVEDRLAPANRRLIPFTRVKRVDRHYIYLDDDTVIPIHRVREVVKKGGGVVWKKPGS